MQNKEYQITVKVDERLFKIIEESRKGTERSRAAQVRWMIEKYLEIREISSPTEKSQTAG